MVCEHCRKIIESPAYDAHVEDHIRRQRLDAINAELNEAADDKEGVTVTGRNGVDFGILDAETPVEVAISVTSMAGAVSLRSTRMRSSGRADEHGLKCVDLESFFGLNRANLQTPFMSDFPLVFEGSRR